MNVPDVVNMGEGMRTLIGMIGSVVILCVGAGLAHLVIRLYLRRVREILDYSDRDYAYDMWKHAERQKHLFDDNPEARDHWMRQELYWSNRHDELSR
jgi:hypothetical protein